MLRRTTGRLGHQLIPEPLGNEIDTFARKRRTVHNTFHELQMYSGIAAAGSFLWLYVMYYADPSKALKVTSSGKIVA